MNRNSKLEKILEERNKLMNNFEINKNYFINKENEERKNFISKNIQNQRNYKIYLQKENVIKINIRDIKLKIKQNKKKTKN